MKRLMLLKFIDITFQIIPYGNNSKQKNVYERSISNRLKQWMKVKVQWFKVRSKTDLEPA